MTSKMKHVQVHTHVPGFTRLCTQEESASALARYRDGALSLAQLQATGQALRERHWARQAQAGLDWVTVGDGPFGGQVARHVALFGCAPRRFASAAAASRHDGTALTVALAAGLDGAAPLASRSWFGTAADELVPELGPDTTFALACEQLFDDVARAQALGHAVKASLIGPLTLLWSSTEADDGADTPGFSRLDLLERLLPVYGAVLDRLKAQGVQWVQMAEPILGLDLPYAWRNAFEPAYWQLNQVGIPLLLATYLSPLEENVSLACRLPVAGVHVDGVRAVHELTSAADWLPSHKVLSVGIVDGSQLWRTDLDLALARLAPLLEKRGRQLWLATSCDVQVPFGIPVEQMLDDETRSWLAFAADKLGELALLKAALGNDGPLRTLLPTAFATARAACASRRAHGWQERAAGPRTRAGIAG